MRVDSVGRIPMQATVFSEVLVKSALQACLGMHPTWKYTANFPLQISVGF